MDTIETQALLWRLRLRYPDAETQHAFEAWLNEDPRHGPAYAASEATTRSGDPHGAATTDEALSTGPTVGRSKLMPGGTILGNTVLGGTVLTASAAALAVFFFVPQLGSDPYEITTRGGERRVVALDAGTRITLNGATRMRFDRRDPRAATLLAGQALFQIRHDAAHPFVLEVAGRRVQDVGTVFDVSRDEGDVRVAVAEGSVLYNPDREAMTLRPGEGLVDAASATAIRRVSTPAAAVGGWRSGQFLYAGEPLATVASDLSRALGEPISVAPGIAARPFSGAITLDGSGSAQLLRLMPALDVTIRRTPGGWAMSAGDRANR